MRKSALILMLAFWKILFAKIDDNEVFIKMWYQNRTLGRREGTALHANYYLQETNNIIN